VAAARYGDERSAPPCRRRRSRRPTTRWRLIERLLAEKDQPGYQLFSPGPVMTSARVKAALVH